MSPAIGFLFRVGVIALAVIAVAKLRGVERFPFFYEKLGASDGCFVESVACYDDTKAKLGVDVWVRVLQWGAKADDEVVAGHAVTVLQHQGRLWAYDINFGFVPLALDPAHREEAASVAAPLAAKYPGITARFPLYREDFSQSPDSAPSDFAAQAVDSERALRDASQVAARLARRRPVALLEFFVRSAVGEQHSAAVAFIFNGRLCVYFPGHGTVPFRVQALSVNNLRQLQQLIRRVHPTASNVRRVR